MILHLHSAEYDDHRLIHVNSEWVKWWCLRETGITHVIVGDGYGTGPTEYPVECIPVTETPDEIDRMWEGKSHNADTYGPTDRTTT